MNYVGIDLGTTNSAICSYDGKSLRLYKSPEQHDVTPSAIFIDRRGNKYVGARAYASAVGSPESAAILFKRLMGTATPVVLPALNRSLTPEECSAEILRVLFGYLPEDVRGAGDTGTVITVPAAFNQMQKGSTLAAADAAALGKVALMQEPVAAVMSVMRQRRQDGIFVVYDLGGGTLDVAIAESIAGRVNLLAHGGIAMCGGRDFDRSLFDSFVKPWLLENFDLPAQLNTLPQFSRLKYLAEWACERSKIELSQRDSSIVSLTESELNLKDRAGRELYLDIPLGRAAFDRLIAPRVTESIAAARETISKAGLSSHDIERVVFVGGPTHYKPLRDQVAFELGIAPSTDVNPMTAVAEGAALFAESIDWASQSRGRKRASASLATSEALALAFNYIARTPDSKARVIAKTSAVSAGAEFQIDSLETGWSSGRIALKDGAAVELPLAAPGDNVFKVFVFDSNGRPVALPQDRLTITRTAASIDAIPASHSIAVAAKKRMGGPVELVYLVKEGEPLPKKGSLSFRAEESLKAGSAGSINFQLWEGEVKEPFTDNRCIGVFKIAGKDIEHGVIAAGDPLTCNYEVLDSGNIVMDVAVDAVAGSFHSGRNLYSRQEGQINYAHASHLIAEQLEHVRDRLDAMQEKITDERLGEAEQKLDEVTSLPSDDPQAAKQAMDRLHEAKRLLAQARHHHLPEMRRLELERAVGFFDEMVRKHARPSEESSFDNLVRTAERAIQQPEFESHLSDLKSRSFGVLWRQEWFVIDRFKWLAQVSHQFPDGRQHTDLVTAGAQALQAGDIEKLREVVIHLDSVRMRSADDEESMVSANIVRG